MKSKISKILLFSGIIVFVIGIILTITSLKLELVGNKIVTINIGEEYQENGVNASYYNLDLKNKVKIRNNIDYNKIGTYYIEYSIDYKGLKKSLKRTIEIVDNTKPEIILEGDNPFYLTYGKTYNEPGFIASDNYDKDLEVIINNADSIDNKTPGEYNIEYLVTDSSGNTNKIIRKVIVEERIVVKNGVTYVEGILIVNKKYSIPSSYGNGVDKEAYNQLKLLQSDAKKLGLTINLNSGYRSYSYQKTLYNNYVKKHGVAVADTFSAKPGHSEHQTGLAFDVGKVSDNFGLTKAGIWLSKNAHLYGFIIRYPKGKQTITGYKYEPWHIRYLGKEIATKVYESGLCLEEYLGIQ